MVESKVNFDSLAFMGTDLRIICNCWLPDEELLVVENVVIRVERKSDARGREVRLACDRDCPMILDYQRVFEIGAVGFKSHYDPLSCPELNLRWIDSSIGETEFKFIRIGIVGVIWSHHYREVNASIC